MKEALDTDWPFPLFFFFLLRIDCNLTVEIYLVENGSFNTARTRIRGVSLSGKKIFLRVPSLAVVSRGEDVYLLASLNGSAECERER